MQRPSLVELERQCQKPEHRRIGNWMACRVARPLALYITWLVAPWGISANAVTLVGWACGLAAAGALGVGTTWGWLAGAALLQIWYVLDHVDGQLARLLGTASLDGVQLDYLMHHTIQLLVPIGIGYGLARHTAGEIWLLAGLAWGVASLLVGLQHDARYKAFIQRLKRLEGTLEVVGGGGGRPEPQPPIPRGLARRLAWLARKAGEGHVVMNTVTLLALVRPWLGRWQDLSAEVYLSVMAVLTLGVAFWSIARSQFAHATEREFAAWFRSPGQRPFPEPTLRYEGASALENAQGSESGRISRLLSS